MVITAVGPALPADGANANDLDVTHGCGQCGTKLTRIRPLASASDHCRASVASTLFISPVAAKRGANVGDRMCRIISYFGMKL
jgi:hypothetical protein